MLYQPNFPSVPFRMGLYPVVDNILWIKRMLNAGVRTIQLRIKAKDKYEIETNIASAIALNLYYNRRLIINDYWNLAIKYKAWGVHLGQDDLKTADLNAIRKAGLRLGISTHKKQEIDIALKIRPSYISLGHIFATKTKQMSSTPQGLKNLTHYVQHLKDYPTVAISGINLQCVSDVIATGVGSIAVVSAITQAENWKLATSQLLDLVGSGDE